jgi:hypothetical protein
MEYQMKNLPKIGELVVVNDLSDATMWRVVELQGKFGVGLIDSGIEDRVPKQKVQWMDKCYLSYPTKKQQRYQEAVKKCSEMDKWAKAFAAEILS